MDSSLVADFSRYLASRFDDPPAYVQHVERPSVPPVQGEPQGGWSLTDKLLQGAFAGLSLYDALDTNAALRRDPNTRERNPLLGSRPSLAKLLAATAAGQVAHGLVTNYLPSGWPRRAWQLGTLGNEAAVVAGNKGVAPFAGLKFPF